MSYYAYVVGSNQLTGKGDQQKHFISKSTLIFSKIDATIKFNSLGNVPVEIAANTWYEFKSNIHTVYVYDDGSDTGENSLRMYFEGVLPQEGRRPE